MYEDFYGLIEDPFRLTPDHRFCFDHRNYGRARAYLDYALHRAEGFVMITGRPGTGKTTLINELLDRLDQTRVKVAMLVSTQMDAEDLLRMVAYALGIESHAANKAGLLQLLIDYLTEQHRHGRRALLVIDEAQDLSMSVLEEVRLLTNLMRSGRPMLQVMLVGQEALRDLVRRPEMEQVHQRLVAAWHLEALSPEETLGYVRHRLEVAGWRGDPVFHPGVGRIVYELSGGVPRRINLVCSRLLLLGFSEELHEIKLADAKCVVGELQEEDLALPGLSAERVSLNLDEDAGHDDRTAMTEDAAGETVRQVPPPSGASHIDWSRIDQGLMLKHPAADARPQEPMPHFDAPISPVPAAPASSTPSDLAPSDEPLEVSLMTTPSSPLGEGGAAARNGRHSELSRSEEPGGPYTGLIQEAEANEYPGSLSLQRDTRSDFVSANTNDDESTSASKGRWRWVIAAAVAGIMLATSLYLLAPAQLHLLKQRVQQWVDLQWQ